MDQQKPAVKAARQRKVLEKGAEREDDWLTTETRGQEALRSLVEQWLKVNGWSFAVAQRLAELALIAQAPKKLRDWIAGMPLKSGDWVNHKGHVYEAVGSPITEPSQAAKDGWKHLGITRRFHGTGLNLFVRRKTRVLASGFFLELGRLNEWIASVQDGSTAAPIDSRMNEAAFDAKVLKVGEKVLGPEEMLAIAVCRLDPPQFHQATAAAPIPQKPKGVPARKLRKALILADVDPVDDWEKIKALYPTDDSDRLNKLRQVINGLHTWTEEEEEDEAVGTVQLYEALTAIRKAKEQKSLVDVDAATVS